MTDDDGRSTDEEGSADLLRRAEETIAMIRSSADEDDLGPALSHLDDLEDIADEAEDVLSTMDLSELVRAIDWEELSDAVDLEDFVQALEDGEISEAVSIGELLDVADLSEVWDAVDASELWRQKGELDDELDDVVGDDEADGSDVELDFGAGASAGDVSIDEFDPAVIEGVVQSELDDAIGEFREAILEAHERLDALREFNEARFQRKRTTSSSRNPTAGFSTLPRTHVGTGTAGLHSTVPEEPRYSNAPSRERIYGRRFETTGGENGD